MKKPKLSGKKKVVNLFYDGEKYKDPETVTINGYPWYIERGKDVPVPVEVAEVLEHKLQQDTAAANMMKSMAEAGRNV